MSKSFNKESISKLYTNSKRLVDDIWITTKIEGEETKIALLIISKIIRNKKVTIAERKFLKEQSKDLLKILPLILLQGIPFPVTPIWLFLMKRHPELLPKDHRDILKQEESKNKD